MHELPPQLWIDILSTQKLYAPSVEVSPDGIPWLRFDCRNMRRINITKSSHLLTETDYIEDYYGKIIRRDENGMFTMYKCINQEYLVQHCPSAQGSNGILVDGGMRYGSWHGDGVGVYAHARKPWEYFSVNDGWAFVELRMHGYLKRVKSGSRGRYVLKSDQTVDSYGAECPDCEVTSVYFMYKSAPPFVTI